MHTTRGHGLSWELTCRERKIRLEKLFDAMTEDNAEEDFFLNRYETKKVLERYGLGSKTDNGKGCFGVCEGERESAYDKMWKKWNQGGWLKDDRIDKTELVRLQW